MLKTFNGFRFMKANPACCLGNVFKSFIKFLGDKQKQNGEFVLLDYIINFISLVKYLSYNNFVYLRPFQFSN